MECCENDDGYYEAKVILGGDFRLSLAWSQDNDAGAEAPVDLTDYILSAKIFANNGEGALVMTLPEPAVAGVGITITDAAAGEFRLDISTSALSTLGEGIYYMQIYAEDEDEFKQVLVRGPLTLSY